MSDNATLIPKIDLKKIRKVIGIDTKSAVRSGFFWGYAGLIDNIINLIKKPIKTKLIEDKDITLKGLIKSLELIKWKKNYSFVP